MYGLVRMNSPTWESSVNPCTPCPFTASTNSQLELYLVVLRCAHHIGCGDKASRRLGSGRSTGSRCIGGVTINPRFFLSRGDSCPVHRQQRVRRDDGTPIDHDRSSTLFSQMPIGYYLLQTIQ